jgi:sulfite reductase beta subunit-like hemoprotein
LYVGGGLGLRPYIGEPLEPFTPEDDLLPTLIAIIRLYDRVGDRSRMHRNRLRYLVHDVGIDVFREAVLRERDVVRATMAPSAELYTQSLEPPPGTGSEPPGNLRRPA